MTHPDFEGHWKTRCPLSTHTIAPGTLLFHGTDSDEFDEANDSLNGPAWLSDSDAVAKRFAQRAGWGGRARILVYRVAEPIELPLVTSQNDIVALSEEFALDLADIETMRDSVQCSGLPGWWIPHNYPEGGDLLLTHTDALEFVESKAISAA